MSNYKYEAEIVVFVMFVTEYTISDFKHRVEFSILKNWLTSILVLKDEPTAYKICSGLVAFTEKLDN